MRVLALILVFFPMTAFTQVNDGSIEGTVLDSTSRLAVHLATVELTSYSLGPGRISVSDKTGFFSMDSLPEGYYKLRISFSGYGNLFMDSILIRQDHKDINLGLVYLKQSATDMQTIVIYAEKPLIQTKDGNITMNVAESPLSAGSNANDLLKNMPLVSSDPDGKITVRGREPRILVDEKPVDLNGMQLNDFLESLPGGMIEKIEIMTNPPAQYAQEPGGVINIVTRKGKAGMNGKLSLYGGTRGELGFNSSLNYRKKGFSFSLTAGDSYNEFRGNSTGVRENFYADSSNALHTNNNYKNISRRPNARFNLDYELNAKNALNVVLNYNGNNFDNDGVTRYENYNNSGENYKKSVRSILSTGNNINPGGNITFTHKGRKEGELLRLQAGLNHSWQENERAFRQKYFDAKDAPFGEDSIQSQFVDNRNAGFNARISYDLPVNKTKTVLSVGSAYNMQRNHVIQDSYYEEQGGDEIYVDILSNDLGFDQEITNLRVSMKHKFNKGYSFNTGLAWERTDILFNLYKFNNEVKNDYTTWLPFAGFYVNREGGGNLSLTYRRSVRRPGIRELNPSIDYTDPYNLRTGNPFLDPTIADNFDLTAGKTTSKYYVNMGLGYNIVGDIFTTLRTLIGDGKTLVNWQNIDTKHEYEISMWSGYTASRSLRLNLNLGYTYNTYSAKDIQQNRYRNGSSVNGKISVSYTPKDVWNFTGNFNYNRFANPQGSVRSTVSMNLGIQKKFFSKKLIATLNLIDPIIQQTFRNETVGTNFRLLSEGTTETRNVRLTLAYLFKFKKIK